MKFRRFPSVFRYTLGAGTLALFASLILATAPFTVAPPPRAVTAVSPPSVAAHRSGGLQAASRASALARTGDLKLPPIPRLVEGYGKLPLSFEANQGQTDSQVKFLSRGPGYTLFLTGEEAVLSLSSQKSVRQLTDRSQQAAPGNWKLENRNSFLPESLLPRPTEYGLRAIDNRQSAIDNSSNKAPTVLRMTLVGANANAKVTGMDPLPGKSNYFIGNDPKKWRTNVSNYAKVKYENVYPGVDLVYYGNQGQLEYDFVVAPGANPKAIALEIETGNSQLETGNSKLETRPLTPRPSPLGRGWPTGPGEGSAAAARIRIDANGDLVIPTDAGEVRFRKPVVYQPQPAVGSRQSAVANDNGQRTTNVGFNRQSSIDNRQFLDGHYALTAKNQVRFEVPEYDSSLPLIIDPVLVYSARFSLGGSTAPAAMAVDSSGNVYLAGRTSSIDFPATFGAFQTACVPDTQGPDYCLDVFVFKLNPDASAVVYATFLGGSREDWGSGIAVDASGNAYVAGSTSSVDFPTTPGVFQPSCALRGGLYCEDAFVAKLSADGSTLVYSTFLGGTGNDSATGVALDDSGSVSVTGNTGAYETVGLSYSHDFPITNALQTACAISSCPYVAKLNPTGTALTYATYLSGHHDAAPTAIAADPEGSAYVTGILAAFIPCLPATWCTPPGAGDCPMCEGGAVDFNFPTTPEAWQPSCRGYSGTGGYVVCGFLSKISGDGSQLVYSTFLGNTTTHALAVDSAGNAYLACPYYSRMQVWKVNPAGSALGYETAIGNDISVNGIAVDAAGSAYVAGTTQSREFPVVNPIQPSLRGQGDCPGGSRPCPDAFVAKLSPDGSALLFSTYFGGEGRDYGAAMALDGSGNIYLTGTTDSYDFPTTSGTLTGLPHANVFVAKIAPEDAPGVALTPVPLRLPAEIDPSLPYQPTVTVRNMGTAPLTITSFAATEGFVASSLDCLATLATDAACTINVGYDSQVPLGPLSGTLTITDNAADSPQSVPLSGDRRPGTYPTLLPSTLDFGQQLVRTTSSAQTVILTASQQEEMAIYAITTSGDFAQTNNCPLAPSTLAAGGSCTINVTFKPTWRASIVKALTITHGTSYVPLSATLKGTGIQPVAVLSTASLTFADQLVRTTSPAQTVILSNAGDAPLNIAGIHIIDSEHFAQSNTCPASLAPGADCTISVTFTPDSANTETGELEIYHDAPGRWSRVALSGAGVTPLACILPATLNFGNQEVGTTSPPQTVAVTSCGTLPLIISGITITGDFAQTNTCPISPATLTRGANCTISVIFTPAARGTRTGHLNVTDNVPPWRPPITLRGMGAGPTVSLYPTTPPLRFVNQPLGTTSAPQAVALTNVGNAPLTIGSITTSGNFAQTNNCVSPLAAGASCTINFTFTPTVVGGQSGMLTVTDNAPGSPHTVALGGVGVGPVATLSATSLNFGNQPVGTTSAPRLVNLSNSGNAALTIASIAASGDFAQTSNCPASLAGASYCTISVTFTPPATVAGGQSGTLTIAHDAAGSPHTVALNGVGVGPVVTLSSTSLNFGNQPLGITSAPKLVNLSNTGNAAMTVSSITADGNFAQTNNCPGSLAARSYCTLTFTFTPTVVGGQSGTLIITDDAAGSPHVVNLSGTGTGPIGSLSTNTLSFAGQIVGTTSPVEAVTLTNSGNAPLGISSIAATGDYALTHNCVSPLAAEASCTLSVTFTPTVAGGRSGTLIIADNAAGSPRTVSLSGIGQDFSLGAFTTARAVSPGMTARFNLLLMPRGGFQQTVSLACSGAPAGATCSVSPSSVTPNGVNNVSVALEVVTTAPAASAPRDGGWRMTAPPGGWPVATILALLGALALLTGIAAVAAVSHRRLAPGTVSPVRTPALQWAPLTVALMLVVWWAACGGGGGLYVRSGGTPAGTYVLTITATTSDLSHSTTVELTVR